MSINGVRVAQLVGITAATGFAGFNYACSYAVIPSILFESSDTPEEERQLISRWRKIYNIGYRISGPAAVTSCLSFGSLAYLSAPYSTSIRNKYIAAAVLLPSAILVHTFVHMRWLLGALNLRAERLAGPGEGTRAERLAKGEARTSAIEASKTTKEMIHMWSKFNIWRSFTGLVGALLGTWASIELSEALGADSVLFGLVR
ncbi:hypothetical protein IWX90DRAFT_27179 [Phyllosticta citrichinensis]|uniref:DUF1772-domain-containing protein n=1 Tax=Phyllosticta citrichinensis TaxID=1130410 RepID=A0ABR1Y7B7_9PEZI